LSRARKTIDAVHDLYEGSPCAFIETISSSGIEFLEGSNDESLGSSESASLPDFGTASSDLAGADSTTFGEVAHLPGSGPEFGGCCSSAAASVDTHQEVEHPTESVLVTVSEDSADVSRVSAEGASLETESVSAASPLRFADDATTASIASLEGSLSTSQSNWSVSFLVPTGKDFVHLVEVSSVHVELIPSHELVDPFAVLSESSSLEESVLAPVPFFSRDDATLRSVAKLEGSLSSSESDLSASVAVESPDSLVESVELALVHATSLELLIDPSAESLEVASLHKSGAAFSPFTFRDNATLGVVAHLPGSGRPSVLVGLSASVAVETGDRPVESVELGLAHTSSLELFVDPSTESLEVASLHDSGAALSPFRFGDNTTLRVVTHFPGSGRVSVLVDLSASVSINTNHSSVEAVESTLGHASLELSADPSGISLEVAPLEESSGAFFPFGPGDNTTLGVVTHLPGSGRVSVLVSLSASVAVKTDNRSVEAVESSLGHASLELSADPTSESLEVASLHESSGAFSPFGSGDNTTLGVVAHLPGSGRVSVLVDLSASVSVKTNHGSVEVVESSLGHAFLEISVDPAGISLEVAPLEESVFTPVELTLGDNASFGSITEFPGSSRVSILIDDLSAPVSIKTNHVPVESVELGLVHATSE
jgi:hypothetical protein